MILCRDDWIRTSGPHVPNVMRYRAALHPAEFIEFMFRDALLPPLAGRYILQN